MKLCEPFVVFERFGGCAEMLYVELEKSDGGCSEPCEIDDQKNSAIGFVEKVKTC